MSDSTSPSLQHGTVGIPRAMPHHSRAMLNRNIAQQGSGTSTVAGIINHEERPHQEAVQLETDEQQVEHTKTRQVSRRGRAHGRQGRADGQHPQVKADQSVPLQQGIGPLTSLDSEPFGFRLNPFRYG